MAEALGVDKEYQRYLAEIELYEKEFKPWETRCKKIVRLYKDDDNPKGSKKRFNVLWSNVETLKPALYARDPQPVAERRFKDADPIGRSASEVLERCLSYTIDCKNYGGLSRQAVLDRLLPGRGVIWHRYEATGEGDEYAESVIPEYVYWEDFGHAIARTWEEVPMVWRRVYMDRAELVKRFPDHGQKIPLDYSPKGLKDEKLAEEVKKAAIYQLYDKPKDKVVALSKSYPKLIESVDDPLKLTGMFPCQRPLYATLTTDSLKPTPDYVLYQTQAQELEELTARIDALQKGLKLVGVYDSSAAGLANILSGGYENKMVPVDDWAKFSEKGGLDGAVDFLPIKEVAETLVALYEAREKSKADLYEITGIADIIRGNSEPEETATAQQIKGRFAVLRISESQADVQRWVRDGMRIMGEIIAEHYDLETIKAISGVKLPTKAEKEAFMLEQQNAMQMAQQTGQQPQPPDERVAELMRQPTWEEVHALLSHQVLREFRIDIETDSTIRTDEDAEKAERTEFLNVAGAYVEKAVMAVQTAPELAPLLTELLMFGVRAHRSARALEPIFEDVMRDLQKPKPPKLDPELQKEQLKAQTAKEIEQLKAQTSAQVEQHKQEMQARENAHSQQIEDARAERDSQRNMEMERYKADITKEVEMFKAQLKAQTDLQVAQVQGQNEREARGEEAQAKEREYQVKDAQSQRQSATTIEVERMKGENADKDRAFQERTRKEDADKAKSDSEASEKTMARREAQLSEAKRLIDSLAQLKRAV